MEKFYISIFDYTTNRECEVEVSESFYREYRRLEWRIKKEEQRFRRNCTPFSALKGEVENFSEFVDYTSDPSKDLFRKLLYHDLRKALSQLKRDELELVVALFFENKNEREYGCEVNISRSTINYKRTVILCKLEKIIMNL